MGFILYIILAAIILGLLYFGFGIGYFFLKINSRGIRPSVFNKALWSACGDEDKESSNPYRWGSNDYNRFNESHDFVKFMLEEKDNKRKVDAISRFTGTYKY